MGVTSPSFPTENLPQGKPIPPGADTVADPEDGGGDITKFTNFMTLLAPPTRLLPVSNLAARGEQIFNQINCSACHVPAMQTGKNSSAALSNVTVRLYSDLLLHRMGPGLADGIQQGTAKGDQFRTAPLWGLRHRMFYLHDGRATTPEGAIMQHGGEASAARDRYVNLNPQDKSEVREFLSKL